MTESESENEFENAFTTRQYESQNSSDNEDENNLPTNNAKKSRVRLNWVYKSTFENKDQSDAWLQNETTWTERKTYDTDAGWHEEYRCNKVPYRGPQCAAAFYLIYNADSERVTMYDTGLEHTHDDVLTTITIRGINPATKESIIRLLSLGVVIPKVIFNNLAKEAATNIQIKVPNERQL